MNVTHNPREGWSIYTAATLTDEEAQAVTFRATPDQVRMGDFVELQDAEGTRIGHVARAEYVERWDGPAYVVVSIRLR